MSLSVTIVVTTRNSIRTVSDCLQSILNQTYPVQLIVIDNFSSDGTDEVAKAKASVFATGGPERSAQRNQGAALATSEVLGFIDSDMVLTSDVVRDVVLAIQGGAGAVIVPERSVGSGYWARVRAYERSFYSARDGVEAARFYRAELFATVGGFDENLTGPEDWDLTIRARSHTKVGRVGAEIMHVESYASYMDACKKKAHYAVGLRSYLAKHGARAMLRSLSDRGYVRQPWLLLSSPGMAAGLLALKSGETVAVASALLKQSLSRPNSD